MNFHTRKWIKPEDLNPNGTLFGGRYWNGLMRKQRFML
ncbi:cytosolic long-chain acyl-CoA thioester hydrolase family protein [Nonlabens ulvanivorans]|uniref:Cytosolic long-chain acyl-CoA thioester hydrolase family protein n=1 Tax=Nonlabens ulvanivorans TaxID=906888 RepID=A0A081DFY4_NONUL|nr:cytosolic long-chain acyl-CoA thioesterhydrolase family protein [Nonlabens ulvanivorans]GAL75663.1 cytosolic long-chain acyl-CoA thioester hydrolase family protein [Nonlabens ulvanivorans]